MARQLRPDAARGIVLAYAGLTFIVARGYWLMGSANVDRLWPGAWGWVFGVVALLLVAHAVFVTNPVPCAVAGLTFHLAVLGRVVCTAVNEHAATVYLPGRALVAVEFLGAILLSTSLVWVHLLWPLARRAPR